MSQNNDMKNNLRHPRFFANQPGVLLRNKLYVTNVVVYNYKLYRVYIMNINNVMINLCKLKNLSSLKKYHRIM